MIYVGYERLLFQQLGFHILSPVVNVEVIARRVDHICNGRIRAGHSKLSLQLFALWLFQQKAVFYRDVEYHSDSYPLTAHRGNQLFQSPVYLIGCEVGIIRILSNVIADASVVFSGQFKKLVISFRVFIV